MVNIYCKLCELYVEVNNWKDHIIAETHINNLPSYIVVKCTLSKAEIGSVHEYFAKFGKITRKEIIGLEGETVKIQYFFEDAKAYCTIIQKQHILFGTKLEIESLKLANEAAPMLFDKQPMDFTNLRILICNTIPEDSTFDQQISMMQDTIKYNNSNKEKTLNSVYTNITAVLQSKFPECKLTFFDSRIAGLDITEDRVEIYVDFPLQYNMNESLALQKMQKLVLESVHFDSVLLLTVEEIPHIRFRHMPTETTCFLSMTNQLAVKENELIQYYTSLDEKIPKLLVTVKFWAKYHELFVEHFMSYGVYLLTIFYLQHEPYNLPSVAELQKKVTPDMENHWNYTFTPGTFSSPALQEATLLELVTGFFKFYESFDFFSHMVSPYCGYAIEKKCFLEPYELPNDYALFMRNKQAIRFTSSLAVQHPFHHSKNIYYKAAISNGGCFASACRDSLKLVESGELNLLSRLLQQGISEDHDDFFLETPIGYSESEFKISVKELTQDIFKKIFCYQISKFIKKSDDINFTFNYLCKHVWTKRVETLKELEPELFFCNEFEKEVAVTSRIAKDGNHKKSWCINISLQFDPKGVKVSLTSTSNDAKMNLLSHYLRVKIGVFLKERIKIDNKESITIVTDLPQFKNLASTIEQASTLLEQIRLLQKKWLQDRPQMLDEYKIIMDDLNSTLAVRFSNEICLFELSKTALNFPNKICTIYFNSVEQQNSEWATVDTIKTLLEKSETFSDVSSFYRTGIVKFLHKKTQTRCILTLTSLKLMMRSTELLMYYFSLDQKLEPLLLTIEMWMNYYKLTEAGYITTYSLHLMVLFYLQQKYKVPSICDLQKNATAVVIDSWNCAIVAAKFTNLELNKATLLELVLGFFKFYSTFDYMTYVVSPFCGYPIEKTKFLKSYHLPEIFKDYTKNEKEISLNLGVCVQDLFEHSKNVLPLLPLQNWSRFTSMCRRTIILIEEQGEQFVSNLFSNNIRDMSQLYEYEIEKVDETSVDCWKKRIKNLAVDILKDILTFKCTETEGGKYECIAMFDVLINRLNVTKNVSFIGISEFEKDVATTLHIKKEYARKVELTVDVAITFKEDPQRMTVSFTSKQDDFNPNFTDFFYIRLINLLKHKNDGKKDVELNLNETLTNIIHIDSDSNSNEPQFSPISSNKDQHNEVIKNNDGFEGEIINDSDAADREKKGPIGQNKSKRSQKKPHSSRSSSRSTGHRRQSSSRTWRRKSRSRTRSPRARLRSRRTRSRSSRTRLRSRRTRSRSPRSRSRSPPRSRSRSPYVRSRSRSSSRLRERLRRLRRRRESEERRRRKSRSWSRERRNRRRSRSRSKDSKDLTRRRRRSRSYSWSPERNEDFAKNQSVLEEIRKKINDIGPSDQLFDSHIKSISGAVPVPSSTLQPTYDESFFIGNQSLTESPRKSVYREEYVVKLYEEKKISLSDYLAIRSVDNKDTKWTVMNWWYYSCSYSYFCISTAQPLTVERMLEKPKVICLCQKAIDVMNLKSLGSILIQPTNSKTKYKSPLLRNSANLRFTNPVKINMDIDPFSSALYKILQKIGLFNEEDDVWKLLNSVAEALSSGAKVDKTMAIQIFHISLLGSMSVNERKEKVSVTTQCKEVTDVEVQVNEDDVGRAKGKRKKRRRPRRLLQNVE